MSKGQATKDRILGQALDIASTVGIEGLSIGELAKATQMSKSGLFAHFESKEDLQLEILNTATRQFTEQVVSPALREPRGEPRVRALFDRWLAWETLRTEELYATLIVIAAIGILINWVIKRFTKTLVPWQNA